MELHYKLEVYALITTIHESSNVQGIFFNRVMIESFDAFFVLMLCPSLCM